MPLTRTVNLQRQNNGGTNTTNLDPITYNSRYPGLDEYNYKKLESKVDNLGLSGYDKEKAMDEGYIQVLPLVQNNIKNSDRRKYINQARYEVSQIQDPDAKLQAKAKLSVTEISQLIKEKYNVDPSANDEEVFNSWINTIPNGGQLLANYMNNGDKELLYKGRLEDRPQGAKEKLGESFWSNTWDKMKAEASVPLDAWEKLIYRTGKDLRNFDTKVMDFFADTLPAKALIEKKLGRDLTDDQYDAIVKMAKAKNQETRDTNKRKVMDYNRMVNYDYQKGKQELDQDIANYYDNKGFTQLLKEGDIGGFFYKGLGDAAQNREMPVIIGATVVNPQMGRTLMAADSYARESEEAFETMLENGANYEQAEETAAKVGLINAAVEVYLDKILGGVETTTANAIRDSFMKNVQKEATKKSLGRVGLELLGTQLKSSGEEGLEEVVQQIVQNAAVKTVNENQGLFDNIGQAFEGGFFNPMNVFAGGSNLIENRGSIQQAAQDFNDSINSMLDNRISVNDVKNAANRVEVAPGKIGETVDSMTIKSADGDKEGVVDRISERGAEKITNTVSAQDKLYKAQEPRMNTLTKNKDLEKRRTNSDRSNELIVQNGYTPTDTTSRLQAHDATMKKIWSQVEEKINGGKEIMVDLSQISDKIDEYVQKQRRTKSTLSEADLEKLEKESAALRGQKISLPDAEALKQLYNAKINNWGDEKVSDVMANGLKEATHEIGVIEDNLLSEIPGQFQDLKNDFGALKDTYEDVFKADMKSQRRKGSGLTETYSRIEGLGEIANGMLGLLTGKGDLGSVAKGATKFLVGKSLAKASDVDFLIEQGFKGLKEEMGLDKNQASSKTAKYQVPDEIKEGAYSNIRFQKYGMADANAKNITAEEGLNIENFKNGRSAKEIADYYGVDIDIVNKILTPKGEKALGMYDKGLITLAKDLKESTVPHELLHATFDLVDTNRKQEILDGIKKKLDVDEIQAEEWLADRFSDYYRTGSFDVKGIPTTFVAKVKQFFKQIIEFIDGTYANRKQIQNLFDDILNQKDLGGNSSSKIVFQSAGDIYGDNFKNWFGDRENDSANASKVVDKDGDPLVVYHGGQNYHTEFKKEFIGSNYGQDTQGFFFTDSQDSAREYADNTSYGLPRQNPGVVMDAYLSLKNPLIERTDYDPINLWDNNYERLLKKANDNGNDGIIIKADEGESLYVAFEPNQIKSASDNVGTYDPNNPDIRYQRTEGNLNDLKKEYHYVISPNYEILSWDDTNVHGALDYMLDKKGIKDAGRSILSKFRALNSELPKVRSGDEVANLSPIDQFGYDLKDKIIETYIKKKNIIVRDRDHWDVGDGAYPNQTYVFMEIGNYTAKPHISEFLYLKLKDEGYIR